MKKLVCFLVISGLSVMAAENKESSPAPQAKEDEEPAEILTREDLFGPGGGEEYFRSQGRPQYGEEYAEQ